MQHRMATRIAIVAAAFAALVPAGGAAAADGVVRPDDRATHGPAAVEAAQRETVVRPDDRADRRLPNDAPVAQPTAGDAFDWADAGIGSVATLGLFLILSGAAVMRLRHGAQAA